MKKIVILSLIIMAFITAGVMPQAVNGDDGQETSLLTPEEQAFIKELRGLYLTIDRILTNNSQVTGETYRKKQDVYWGQRMLLEGPTSCSVNYPDTFKQVGKKWNTEVCPAFIKLQNDLFSCFDEAIKNIDVWGTIAGTRLNDRVNKLGRDLADVQEAAGVVFELAENRAAELTAERKELQKKAKEKAEELLKNKETGDSGGDKDKGGEAASSPDKDKKDSGDSDDLFSCFIATAAYGSPQAEEIDTLRQFRDEFLVHNYPGRAFVAAYYATSPPVAAFISEHEMLRVAVREGFVAPVVTVLELTESWWAE